MQVQEWAPQQVGLVLGGVLLGVLVERVARGVVHSVAKRTSMVWDDLVVEAFPHGHTEPPQGAPDTQSV
jgi:hypothetical protein